GAIRQRIKRVFYLYLAEIFGDADLVLLNPVIAASGLHRPASDFSIRIRLLELGLLHVFEEEPESRIRSVSLLNIRVEIDIKRILDALDVDFLIERFIRHVICRDTPVT